VYDKDDQVTITISDNNTEEFSHWTISGLPPKAMKGIDETQKSIKVTMSGNALIEANYKKDGSVNKVNEIPIYDGNSDDSKIIDYLNSKEDGEVVSGEVVNGFLEIHHGMQRAYVKEIDLNK